MRDRGGSWADVPPAERVPVGDLNGFASLALACFWTGFVAIYSARSVLVGVSPLDNMVPRILVAAFGAALSWGMHCALDRMRPHSIAAAITHAVAVSVPVSVAFAVGHELIFTPLAVPLRPHCAFLAWRHCPQPETWTAIVDNAVNWTFLFSAWGLLHLAARSALERWTADLRAGEQREAARIAEIRALRYQVNPHFLFNCLNALATLLRRPDRADAEGMIEELGAFLRYGLATDLLTDVELEDEVGMQQRYLALECRRFGDRLSVDVEVADDVRRARVPSLILQPLVENAISHGVAMTTAPTLITITAFRTDDGRLAVVVEDDAWTGDQDDRQAGACAGLGIGLRNVSARLAARFDGDATCTVTRMPIGGFRAELEMPLVVADRADRPSPARRAPPKGRSRAPRPNREVRARG